MSEPSTFIVTGAAGFIGARFVEAARARGARLLSVDFQRPGQDAFVARPEHRGLDFGRTVDLDALPGLLEQAPPPGLTAIVHLGACTDTMELDEAVHTRLNLDYSRRLWRLATALGVPLVYASSAATYGGGELGYDDAEALLPRLQPLNPYGWSKHNFDLWALAEEAAGRHPPAWAGFKFFNVYGFGERHKGRMASVVLHGFDQIRAGGKVRLFRSHRAGIADGEQRRDFVYVEDIVDALLWAATTPVPRGIYNLGSGAARTFLDLARATFSALGLPEHIELIDMPVELRERYQYFTQAELGRLRAAGYQRPFTSLEEGVARTVARLVEA